MRPECHFEPPFLNSYSSKMTLIYCTFLSGRGNTASLTKHNVSHTTAVADSVRNISRNENQINTRAL